MGNFRRKNRFLVRAEIARKRNASYEKQDLNKGMNAIGLPLPLQQQQIVASVPEDEDDSDPSDDSSIEDGGGDGAAGSDGNGNGELGDGKCNTRDIEVVSSSSSSGRYNNHNKKLIDKCGNSSLRQEHLRLAGAGQRTKFNVKPPLAEPPSGMPKFREKKFRQQRRPFVIKRRFLGRMKKAPAQQPAQGREDKPAEDILSALSKISKESLNLYAPSLEAASKRYAEELKHKRAGMY